MLSMENLMQESQQMSSKKIEPEYRYELGTETLFENSTSHVSGSNNTNINIPIACSVVVARKKIITSATVLLSTSKKLIIALVLEEIKSDPAEKNEIEPQKGSESLNTFAFIEQSRVQRKNKLIIVYSLTVCELKAAE